MPKICPRGYKMINGNCITAEAANSFNIDGPNGLIGWDSGAGQMACEEMQWSCDDTNGNLASTWGGQTSSGSPPFCNCTTYIDYIWEINEVPTASSYSQWFPGMCFLDGWHVATNVTENSFMEGLEVFAICLSNSWESFEGFYGANQSWTQGVAHTDCHFNMQACLQHNWGDITPDGGSNQHWKGWQKGGRIKTRRGRVHKKFKK